MNELIKLAESLKIDRKSRTDLGRLIDDALWLNSTEASAVSFGVELGVLDDNDEFTIVFGGILHLNVGVDHDVDWQWRDRAYLLLEFERIESVAPCAFDQAELDQLGEWLADYIQHSHWKDTVEAELNSGLY